MKDVAIVGYCRTGIAKAGRGALNQTHTTLAGLAALKPVYPRVSSQSVRSNPKLWARAIA
jgi:acetyl-CoA acetyltransferase